MFYFCAVNVLSKLTGQKLAVLLDPDGWKLSHVETLLRISGVDLFLVGGSYITDDQTDECIQMLKAHCNTPIILFPGSPQQINPKADALLLLSLISGRNPDLLIGRHVEAAPTLRKSGLELISTGYMLVDGGQMTTAQYISGTFPLPSNKPELAAATAMAGEMLGLKCIYLDAGSGARYAVSEEIIEAVSNTVELPLIVGGGIRTPEKVQANFQAGANVVVVGNALERDPALLLEMVAAKKEALRRV